MNTHSNPNSVAPGLLVGAGTAFATLLVFVITGASGLAAGCAVACGIAGAALATAARGGSRGGVLLNVVICGAVALSLATIVGIVGLWILLSQAQFTF